MENMTPRQMREVEYHRQHASIHSAKSKEPVHTDIIVSSNRRPWNATWSSYDLLMKVGLKGKKLFVPGCGFGEDAIRLCLMGAEVYGSDISPDVLEIASQRAALMGVDKLHLETSPIENLPHADNSFDGVFLNDILHHVDIPKATEEIKRVLKPGGVIIGNELYTHNAVQRIRESAFVTKVLYKAMVPFIYGNKTPYITEDEHKIDEIEFSYITRIMKPSSASIEYFMLAEGRIIPQKWDSISRFDRGFLKFVGHSAASRLGGRVVFSGMIDK